MATAIAPTPTTREQARPTLTLATPERSHQQRKAALERANEIRSLRARLKRELKAGRAELVQLVLQPPDYLATAKVWDLLLAVPKLGPVKVNHLLRCQQISPSKTIGGLSARQRDALIRHLRMRERHP